MQNLKSKSLHEFLLQPFTPYHFSTEKIKKKMFNPLKLKESDLY